MTSVNKLVDEYFRIFSGQVPKCAYVSIHYGKDLNLTSETGIADDNPELGPVFNLGLESSPVSFF